MIRKIIHLVAAARPNFMKIAPLFHALKETDWSLPKIVHTGQHYDFNMSDVFFEQLKLPEPDFHLGVGSGSHAQQTGGVMINYESICGQERPDWIIVVGDVNSTAACAIVGAKLWIPVAHLEAGLRSRDRRMPEEINRLVTDAICDLLWTPSQDASENLRAEGIPEQKIEMIGNIMIDSYEMVRSDIESSKARELVYADKRGYAVVTLHRPSNVDAQETLQSILAALSTISELIPLVFVAHPRTIASLDKYGLRQRLSDHPTIQLIDPLPYTDFMSIVTASELVITDSGGLQEESTYLNIPCLTLRENTERPVTVSQGSNRLVDVSTLGVAVDEVLAGRSCNAVCPPLWDGQTAARAVKSLHSRIMSEPA